MRRTGYRILSASLAGLLLCSTTSVAEADGDVVYYDSLPPAADVQSSYVLDPGKWPGSTITYSFANTTGDLPIAAQRAAVRAALKMWADVAPLRFQEVTGAADIEFSWQTGNHGDPLDPFDGPGGVLAHAFFPPPTYSNPIAGDVHFDDAETWTDAPRGDDGQPFDLVTVAAHEIGHALGLRHSGDSSALMAPFYLGSHRLLAQDDIAGIRAKYAPPTKWSDYMCPGTEVCAIADVNGDNRDDAIAVIKGTSNDIWVALSNGTTFGPPTMWSEYMCPGVEVCAMADVNGDNRSDAVAFTKGTTNDVAVALSNGAAFGAPQKWSDYMCPGNEVCAIADVNGDNRDDVIAVIKSAQGEPNANDIWVALSNGTSFGVPTRWSDYMCPGAELCKFADVNGDNRDDAIAVIKGTSNDIWVALSNGTTFGPPTMWSDYMCPGVEVCAMADVNGDNRSDALAFTKGTTNDVWVALSSGAAFGAPLKWSEYMCPGNEVCAVGDTNGDGRHDTAAFIKSTQAEPDAHDIWVTLS